MPASADKLHAVKADRSEASAKAQMPERKAAMSVDMHPAATHRADAVCLQKVKCTIEAEHFTAGDGLAYIRIGVVEAFQPGGNA